MCGKDACISMFVSVRKIREYASLKVGDWLKSYIHLMEYSNHLKGCSEIDLLM